MMSDPMFQFAVAEEIEKLWPAWQRSAELLLGTNKRRALFPDEAIYTSWAKRPNARGHGLILAERIEGADRLVSLRTANIESICEAYLRNEIPADLNEMVVRTRIAKLVSTTLKEYLGPLALGMPTPWMRTAWSMIHGLDRSGARNILQYNNLARRWDA